VDSSIDGKLLSAFTPKRILQAFYDYKFSKWDHFTKWEDPEICIPVGADGIKYAAFEKQLERNVRNISRRIIDGSYIFYPFREVEKEKEPGSIPKKIRILSIASIRDALVQNILYSDVLYGPIEELFRNLDRSYPVSFAYRRGKSAQQAAKLIHEYLQTGYTQVFDADLSKFFDTIPQDKLLERFSEAIGENESITYHLIRRFIHVDRVEFSTYKHAKRKDGSLANYRIFHWKKPNRARRLAGVPQGGVLSGMLANLYLHNFDDWVIHNLGKRIDLKYVRYADDFIILVKDHNSLPQIRREVIEQMTSLGLILNEEKTKDRDVLRDGLDFLGFHFDSKEIRARKRNIDRYKQRILDAIKNEPDDVRKKNDLDATLRWIIRRINGKVLGRSEFEICPKCGYSKRGSPRSWMAFFQAVTDIQQIREIDKWTRTIIYDRLFEQYHQRISRTDLKRCHLKSLVNQWYGISKAKVQPCLCDIDQNDPWKYMGDMFKGKKFTTLQKKKEFYVADVTDHGMDIRVGGRSYEIKKSTIIDLWNRLHCSPDISRAQLEKEGYTSTSQIVALLARFPGVEDLKQPIRLVYRGYHTANFLTP
jgi:RNA-directed DNA polymerase